MTATETPLPQDVVAERGILDCILADPDVLVAVRAILPSETAFYTHEHRTIYRAMCAVVDAGDPLDLITLLSELERTGQLEDAGGAAGVGALGTFVPEHPHVEHYAKIVQRHAVKRLQFTLAGTLAASALELGTEPAETAALIRGKLDALDAHLPAASAPYHLMSIADMLNQPRPAALIDGFYTLNSYFWA